MHSRPTRVVLNFASKCAMNCEWCYVPFGGKAVKKELLEAIVDCVASLGFRVITVGGGDPFQYPFVEAVLRKAKTAGLFVHVDTNGRSLRQVDRNYRLIEEAIDLLGLPLDGPSAAIHDSMRSAPGHFELVLQRLRWLDRLRARLKINTIVSRQNVDFLQALCAEIRTIAPARWSLYQYWPLGPAARVSGVHWVDDGLYLKISASIAQALADTAISLEVTDKESRRATYPIVHHDGAVFVHDRLSRQGTLRYVCEIFDAGALQAINEQCGSERPTALARYQ